MSLGLIYKNAAHIFDEVEKKTPYLEYPLFQETGIVTSAFSTRLGGVSEGYYSSLNLSFDRGDDPARVLENFKRIGASMGVAVEDMVLSKQTHTTNVRVVTKEDKGKGVMRERNYTDVDGMITNVPGICLVTSYADCVPLYFVDPVKKAIGLSHSGWRGTVGKIGKNTVQLMQENFGSKPEDLLAAVGPSVCMDCYEVSEDVIEQFKEAFEKKKWVVSKAIKINSPNKNDIIDVLSNVGGFDIAGMTGVFLGAAYYKIPVVIDGFISAVAALSAA